MTRDEHRSILNLLERTCRGAQTDIDVEADAIIRAFFVRNPDSAYRLTMLALALSEAPPDEQIYAAPRRQSWFSAWLGAPRRASASLDIRSHVERKPRSP
ncbi:MAG: hypothetical protein POH28_16885 [Acidocella sp.]|nr:hypothetical protein [Acidocella sp.]